MNLSLVELLSEGGKKNTLGRVNDVIELVLRNQSKLSELYQAIYHHDAWIRMRAMDAFEKICRVHPQWINVYVDKMQVDLSASTQPSIQWHLAQIYNGIQLDEHQKRRAIEWLIVILSTRDIDWIVAVNTMSTLAEFVRKGDADRVMLIQVLEVQRAHKSSAVVKRVDMLLSEFS